MERLTVRINGYAHGKKGRDLDHLSKKYHRGEFECTALVEKLCEYEDAEESGRLVRLPCDTVYFVCNPGTQYAIVGSIDIRELSLSDIKNIDKTGLHWSTREAAEKALEAMK